MRAGGRIAAAIDVLVDMEARKRPAADALKDWMLSHRFAGSKDRGAIGDMVFAALRWKASSAWRMGDDAPRAWVLGALRWGFAWEHDALAAAFADPHAPPALGEAEARALESATLDGAPAWVVGDYPDWLDDNMARAFGDARGDEGAALAAPAPLDLRANALKCTRDDLIAALAKSPRLSEAPQPTPFSPDGVRIPWREGRTFPWQSEPAFAKGWFEVQDEGSQLAARAAGVEPGMQVADVCAGGGGKTLALAALMKGKGQIYAHDIDGRRLTPIYERLKRAGVRNAQVRAPERGRDVLADLTGRMDVVFVDAPCSGSGTWRRAPDSKWRLRPRALETRKQEQAQSLALAAPLVKPGGRLMYVTCSVLPDENDDAVDPFVRADGGFEVGPSLGLPEAGRRTRHGVQLSPLQTGCDGFYVATLIRAR